MQIQRLFEIVYILLQRKRVTAKELAEHFEVSSRTIYRDLDTLSMAGIPLYTTKGNNGGIFLLDDYVLPKSLLTDAEQEELLNALQTYQFTNKEAIAPLITKLSSTFAREQTNWVDVDFSDWGNDHRANTKFRQLKDAILSKLIITFTYHNSNGQSRERRVEPLQLLFKGQSWYLAAYCLDKEDQRLFKLSRIEELFVHKQTFRRELDKEALNDGIAPTDPEMVSLTLLFEPTMAYRIYDEFYPDQVHQREDGRYLVHQQFPQGDWIYSYLMSFMDEVTVVKPENVRDELIRRYQKVLKKYPNMTG